MRRVWLWSGLLGSLVMLAVVWTVAQGQTPTIDQINITASYIVQGATLFRETEIVLTLGGTPTATLPFSAAQFNSFNSMPTDATLASRGLTQQAIAQRTPSATYDLTSFAATATSVRATVLAYRSFTPTPSPTAIPSLTFPEVDDLGQKWVGELTAAFGFYHPVFDRLVYNRLLRWQGRDSIWRDSDIAVDLRRTTVEGDTYVIGFVTLMANDALLGNIGLLAFREDETPELMLPYSPYSWNIPKIMGAFADYNQNGYPDLMLENRYGGDCPRQETTLLEVRPGEIVNITPANSVFLEMVDLDGDAIPEIAASRQTWYQQQGVSLPDTAESNCPDLTLVRWFRWNGDSYQDISPELGEAFYPRIVTFWELAAQDEDGCLLPDRAMYDLLLDYELIGKLEEGWARLYPQLNWDACPATVLSEQGEAMGAFLSWVGDRLQLSQQAQGR
ncbi:MAG: hypothetical protein H6672_20165 [Anaerolineaceae bacterium]|nr:hypothetical protein [Anaerolineaceae bacterium]